MPAGADISAHGFETKVGSFEVAQTLEQAAIVASATQTFTYDMFFMLIYLQVLCTQCFLLDVV